MYNKMASRSQRDTLKDNVEKFGPLVVYTWMLFNKPIASYCAQKYVHNLVYLFNQHAEGSLPSGTLIFLDKKYDIQDGDYKYRMDQGICYKTHFITKEQEIITLKEMDPVYACASYGYVVQ